MSRAKRVRVMRFSDQEVVMLRLALWLRLKALHDSVEELKGQGLVLGARRAESEYAEVLALYERVGGCRPGDDAVEG